MTVEDLKAFGANTEEAVRRCANKEELFLRLVKAVPTSPEFDKLKEAVAEGDQEKIFEYAHGLKGVTSNLSLTPLVEPISKITEMARAKENGDYATLLEEALAQRDKLAEICAEG